MPYFYLLSLSFLFIAGALVIYGFNAIKSKVLTCWIVIVLFLSLAINIFWLCCYYFTGVGVTWAVVYTLTSSLTGVGINSFVLPAILVVLFFSLVMFIAVKFLSFSLEKEFFQRRLIYSILAFILTLISLTLSPLWTQVSKTTVPMNGDNGKDYYHYYIPPAARIDSPEYNLVYIYAESLERTYFDDANFPELTNALGAQKLAGLDFSSTQQYAGMDFTIGGIVASQCGLPLFTPSGFGNNSDVTSDFFSGKLCLGDILKQSGYDNYFYQGANLRFANKDKFFHAHGIENIFGLEESKYKDDLAYQNEWGLYDNIVLDQVWEKYKSLSASGKRFSIFALTLDTHPPRGYIPKECQSSGYAMNGESMPSLSAVQCSQREIATLVDRIRKSPWGKKTIVVVSSDHLAMNNTSVAIDYLKKYERRNLFFILKDGVSAGVNAKPRNTMDNGATVLELLGGGNNLGLGRSTLSRTSLTARFADFDSKIVTWSPHVQKAWGTPLEMSDYAVDTAKETLSFSNKIYPLPLLVGFSAGKPSLLTDRRGDAPLRFKLARLTPDNHFIWLDRCFQMGNIWARDRKDIVLSTDWCKAEGSLSGKVAVTKLPSSLWHGAVQRESASTPSISQEETALIIKRLGEMNSRIRYPAEGIRFYLEGMPDGVTSIDGLGKQEFWGRWSDAMLAPEVTLTWQQALPDDFWMNIVAKAYGDNIQQPIAIRVGEQTQYIRLGSEISAQRVHFEGASGKSIVITPPHPMFSREGNIVAAPTDASMRKIGVGLVSLDIEPSDPSANAVR